MAPSPDRRLITIAEAAERNGVSVKSIRRWINDGLLPAHRVGPRLIRLDSADVDALVRPLPTVSTGHPR